MFRSLVTGLFLCLAAALPAGAQTLQDLLQENRSDIERPSRRTIGPVIAEIAGSGLPGVQTFLEQWADRAIYQDEETGFFHIVETDDEETYRLLDLGTGEVVGTGDGGAKRLSLRPLSCHRSRAHKPAA